MRTPQSRRHLIKGMIKKLKGTNVKIAVRFDKGIGFLPSGLAVGIGEN